MMPDDIARKIDELQAEYQRVGDEIADGRARIPDARREDREIKRARHQSASAYDYYSYPENERELRDEITDLMSRRDDIRNELIALRAQQRTSRPSTGFRHRQPSAPPPTSPRLVGTVKWYNVAKGYGFVSVPGQPDVFVPASSLMEGRQLESGDVISFIRTQSAKGYKAVDVRYQSV